MLKKKKQGIDHAEKIEQEAAAEAKNPMSDIDPQGEAAFDEEKHADASATADANFGLTEEGAKIEELENQVKDLTAKLSEMEKLRLLALAELDNQRKRVARELDTTRCNTLQDTAFPFLQVYDHFTMAVAAAGKASAIDTIVKGLQMIEQEFTKAFNDLDIAVLDAVGKPFDPAIHEAVAEESSDTVPQGIVIRQWSRGYQCGSRLLKPAMVVVSSGPAAKAETEEAPQA